MRTPTLVFPLLAIVATASGCPSKDAPKDKPSEPKSATPAPSAAAPTSAAPARYHGKKIEGGHAIEVRVETQLPAPHAWDLPATFKDHCAAGPAGAGKIEDQSLLVANGGVDGAVVWLDGIAEGEPLEPAKVTQDQKGCIFTPHVFAAPVGATLHLTNGDPANHMVLFELEGAPALEELRRTIPPNNATDVVVKPEWAGRVARVSCPIHPWMWSYAHFFDHPYFAVTRAGVARLERVPPGTHKLVVWHEGLGASYGDSLKLPPATTARADVTVASDDVKRTFVLDASGLHAR